MLTSASGAWRSLVHTHASHDSQRSVLKVIIQATKQALSPMPGARQTRGAGLLFWFGLQPFSAQAPALEIL